MTTTIIKVNLRDYGTEQAIAHKGNPDALFNAFLEIRSGHIMDESADIEQQLAYQKQLDEQIAGLEKNIITLEKDSEKVTAIEIPALESKIDDLDEEIHEWRKKTAEAHKPHAVNSFNLWRLGLGSALGLLYIIVFYISAVYMGMTRDLDQDLKQSEDNESLNTVFNAIFSVDAFTHFNFHWFAPILLFLFATLLEALWKKYQGRKRYIVIGLAVLATLVLDGLIAYKIEETNQQLRIMTGAGDPNHAWWHSSDFYTVLMMGFIGTLIWGGVVMAFVEELGKTDMKKLIGLEIERRKEKIQELKDKIVALRNSLLGLQAQIKQLEIDIKRLNEEKQTRKVSLTELERYAAMFYDGWIKLVATIPNNEALHQACESKYQYFRGKYLNSSAA